MENENTNEKFDVKEKKSNLRFFTVTILLSVFASLITGGAIYYVMREQAKSDKQKYNTDIAALEAQINELQEKTTLKTYTDEELGFSFQYPSNVKIASAVEDKRENDEIELSVSKEKIDLIKDVPLGYSKEVAIKDKELLAKGEYGENIDFAYPASKKVIKSGNTYMKSFIVFSRIEVCDIDYKNIIIFYKDNYRVIITIHGPINKITSENLDYFEKDITNCGDHYIWKQEEKSGKSGMDFYTDLVADKLSDTAEDWYSASQSILNSIEIK